MLPLDKIRDFSLRVSADPSLWGRALGYGFFGILCVLTGLLGMVVILLTMILSPFVVLSIPVGFLASKVLLGAATPAGGKTDRTR